MICAFLTEEFVTAGDEFEHGTNRLAASNAGDYSVMIFDADLADRQPAFQQVVNDFVFAPFDVEL